MTESDFFATNSPLSGPHSVEALKASLSGSQSLYCMFCVVQMPVGSCHVHYATTIWLLYKDIDRISKSIVFAVVREPLKVLTYLRLHGVARANILASFWQYGCLSLSAWGVDF